MKAFLRERLVEELARLPAVLDAYARNEADFPDRAVAWIEGVEHLLQRLRHPRAAALAVERGRIRAVEDGMREPELEKVSVRRRARRIAASRALARVQEILDEEVRAIDRRFAELREKLAQLVAVASASESIPLPPTDPWDGWVRRVWSQLATQPDTRGLAAYLEASLPLSDRTYLLGELLHNLLEAAPAE